jgi:predicted DNA-binding transcriptional regulator AlpA
VTKWSGRKPALAREHWHELVEVRRRIREIPTIKELSERWGVSESTVYNYLRNRLPKQIHVAEN